MSVRAKKQLGQHFLRSQEIAGRIADIFLEEKPERILEIGPGTGVLTQELLKRYAEITAVELDVESVEFLKKKYSPEELTLIEGDFLKLQMEDIIAPPFSLIGNFPYNISSQIVFKIIEWRDQIPAAGGMFQKEVAERIAAKPGSKVYGILSVWTQAFYDVKYLFTVDEGAFIPPPKVKSGVISLHRYSTPRIQSEPKSFLQLVKMAFGQRRKMLRSSLKNAGYSVEQRTLPIFERRPEQLSVEEFDELNRLRHEH